MQATSNPLRIHFRIAVFLLFCMAFSFCIRLIGNKSIFASGWEIVHKLTVVIGLATFIFLYIRKSMLAWYAVAITFACVLPFFFLITLPESSKISVPKLQIILVILWILACSDLWFKRNRYNEYVENV